MRSTSINFLLHYTTRLENFQAQGIAKSKLNCEYLMKKDAWEDSEWLRMAIKSGCKPFASPVCGKKAGRGGRHGMDKWRRNWQPGICAAGEEHREWAFHMILFLKRNGKGLTMGYGAQYNNLNARHFSSAAARDIIHIWDIFA